MQFAKDSFFVALQERLAGLNPKRTVTLNGATVPAVLVPENLPPSFAKRQANTFYVEWGSAEVREAGSGGSTLMSIDVVISYFSVGSVASMVDRGRLMTQLDRELLAMCQPGNTEKRDYTQSPSADLGTRVFWNEPSFKDRSAGGASGGVPAGTGERRAEMRVYFFPEVIAS